MTRRGATMSRKVRLKAPDKLVRVDILARAVAVPVPGPKEIFSIYAPAQAGPTVP